MLFLIVLCGVLPAMGDTEFDELITEEPNLHPFKFENESFAPQTSRQRAKNVLERALKKKLGRKIGDEFTSEKHHPSNFVNESIALETLKQRAMNNLERALKIKNISSSDGDVDGMARTFMYAPKGEYPFVVLIGYGLSISFCTGSIISEKYVLSSYNCIKYLDTWEINFKVYAGEVTILLLLTAAQTRSVSKVYYYPHYYKKIYYLKTMHFFNVAVLKVSKRFKFGKYIQPAKISIESPIRRENCVVAGFQKGGLKIKVLLRKKVRCIYMCSEVVQSFIQHHYTTDAHCCVWPGASYSLLLEGLGGPLICDGQVFGVASCGMHLSVTQGSVLVYTTPWGDVLDWLKKFM